MKKTLYIFLIVTLFLVGCNTNNSNETHFIKIVSINDIDDLYSNKNGIYYFGRPDCLECIEMQEHIEKKKTNQQIQLKYINTAYWKKNDLKFMDFLNDNQIESVPVLIEYSNNTEIKRSNNVDDFLG